MQCAKNQPGRLNVIFSHLIIIEIYGNNPSKFLTKFSCFLITKINFTTNIFG